MHISDKQLEKFRELYKKKFNQIIDRQEAFASLTKLVNLIRIIDKPITEAEFERLQERRKELGIVIQ